MGGDDFFRYSSAAEWNYFGDSDKQTTVELWPLASRIALRLPVGRTEVQRRDALRIDSALLQ